MNFYLEYPIGGSGSSVAGVSSLNTLTGAVTIGPVASTVGNAITIATTSSTNPHTPIIGNVLGFNDAVQDTWANIAALKAASTLVEGFYMITNPSQALRVIVRAEFGNTVAVPALGLFANPDYQLIGDYSGIPLQTGNGANLGNWNAGLVPAASDIAYNAGIDNIWYINLTGVNTATSPDADPTNWATVQQGEWSVALEASLINNSVVIFSGSHYAVTNAGSFNGTDPATNVGAYTALGNTLGGVGYILAWDGIKYQFDAEKIRGREDERYNVYDDPSFASFQWGNDAVISNIVHSGSSLPCLNNLGTITGTVVDSNSNITMNLNAGITYSGCKFSSGTTLVVNPALSYSNEVIEKGKSTFQFNLPAAANYAAGVLTIPSGLSWVGTFNFTDTAGGTIFNIVNGPTNHPFRFTNANTISNTIQPVAIASAAAGDIVSDGGNVTLTGRTNGKDFYEFISSGNVYMKNNVTALT